MTGFKHGWFGTKVYKSWCSMKQRCLNPDHPFYGRYGGRGITICRRWMKFENFLEDMGDKPSPLHTLERLDNDGNYTPRNCVWRTRKDQANNRKGNRFLTNRGRTLTISQWSDHTGLLYVTIFKRLERGWTPRKALEAPLHV